MGKLKDTNKKIEEKVVTGYKKVEDTVVSGYKKIEGKVVSTYEKVEDKFVDKFLREDDETIEEAKVRLKKEAENVTEEAKTVDVKKDEE